MPFTAAVNASPSPSTSCQCDFGPFLGLIPFRSIRNGNRPRRYGIHRYALDLLDFAMLRQPGRRVGQHLWPLGSDPCEKRHADAGRMTRADTLKGTRDAETERCTLRACLWNPINRHSGLRSGIHLFSANAPLDPGSRPGMTYRRARDDVYEGAAHPCVIPDSDPESISLALARLWIPGPGPG